MRARALFAAVASALVASSLTIVGPGCGSTGSARFRFVARAGGIERDPATPFVFTNEVGWTVSLSKATVTIGPVYLNVVAPLRTGARRNALALFRAAYAHEAHLGGGRIVGEVLAQVTFDALSPVLVPFATDGTMIEEQVRTCDVWLWPDPGVGPETKAITTPVIDLIGRATRDGTEVRFRGALVLDDAWSSDAEVGRVSSTPISETRKVRGIPSSFYPSEGGALEIRLDVRALFRGAQFSMLEDNPTDEDGTKVLVQSKSRELSTDQVTRNLYQGIRAASGTYAVRWTTP